MGYPDREQERRVVTLHGNRTAMPRLQDYNLAPICDGAWLAEALSVVERVRLSPEIVDYVVDLVRETRQNARVRFGASPRAANMLASAARACAVLGGRDFVIPDDVKRLALPVLRHRIILSPGAEIEGATAESVIKQVVATIAAPR
jgi:MoxR-like ATPase